MEVHTNGSSNHIDQTPAAEAAAPSSFDTEVFKKYLLGLLPPVLGVDLAELYSLFDDEFEERVTRFAADTGGVIYVVQVKEVSEGAS